MVVGGGAVRVLELAVVVLLDLLVLEVLELLGTCVVPEVVAEVVADVVAARVAEGRFGWWKDIAACSVSMAENAIDVDAMFRI